MKGFKILSKIKSITKKSVVFLQNMEETSEELPNFSISIDFLGPDPTSSKNKAEENLQVARFADLNLNKNVACF